MSLIDNLKLQSEEELYTTVSEYIAEVWPKVQKQDRSGEFISRVIRTQDSQLNRLIGNVNRSLPYGETRLKYLDEMKRIYSDPNDPKKGLLNLLNAGSLPSAGTMLVTTLILDVGAGDLGYCLKYYKQARCGTPIRLIEAENKRLFNIFESEGEHYLYRRKVGCSVSRPQMACTYLEMVQPLFREGADTEVLYGGHYDVFRDKFLNQWQDMVRRVDHDINREIEFREHYKNLGQWGVVTKQLEPELGVVRRQLEEMSKHMPQYR